MTDQRTRTGVDQVVTDDRGAGRLPGRPWSAFGPATASALMVLFLGLAIFTQAAIDRSWTRRKVERLLYLPKSEHLRLVSLGFDEVAADYYWLRTIGYFGGHYMADKRYPWLAHILQLVTDLDPRFSIVYYFGGIVLAMEAHQVDESNALLAKGMRHLPDNWKFPFFIGFNYFFFKGDFLAASDYIEQAARLPGHPGYLPRLAATLKARTGNVGDAIVFLETTLQTVDDDNVRQALREKIDDLRAGRMTDALETVVRMQK